MAVAKQGSSECLTHAALPTSDFAGFLNITVLEAVETAPTHAAQGVLALHSGVILNSDTFLAGVAKW
jgi:hypothetical protein